MIRPRLSPLAPLAMLAALAALAGCAPPHDNNNIRVTVMADAPAPYRVGALPADTGSALVRNAVAQGLVAFDSNGEIAPALAERWIITDDGLSYIFRLGDARWSGAGDVSARDVASALRLRLRELKSTRFASDIAAIAEIVPMTGDVLEIRLKELRPSFLNILAQPEFGLIHDGGGSGPMKALRIGQAMQLKHRRLLTRNREELTSPLVAIADAPPALAMVQFKAGQSDLVLGGRFQHLALLDAARIDGARIRFDPVTGLFGFQVMPAAGFLGEARNREAIAMAIDRPRLLAMYEVMIWRETTTIVPSELQNRAPVGRPSWTYLDNMARQAEARARVAAWTAAKGAPPPLRIALPHGGGATLLFQMVRADLARIGLTAIRVAPSEKADLRLIDEVSDYDSPLWYLARLSCARVPLCSADADETARQAVLTPDLEQRKKLLGEAELALTAHSSFIPIAMPVRFALSRANLPGFAPNYRGWHLLQNLGEAPD